MAFVVETAINGSKRCWVESSMAVAVARKAVSNSFAMDKISATARAGDLGRADFWPSFESRPKRTREKAKAAYIAANNEIDHALPKAEVIAEGGRTQKGATSWIHVERLH